jgi:hypothetical protein
MLRLLLLPLLLLLLRQVALKCFMWARILSPVQTAKVVVYRCGFCGVSLIFIQCLNHLDISLKCSESF